MLVTFPIQGYGWASIIFSTLFLIASYWFVWFFFKYTGETHKETFSHKCGRAALWYLVISSLGPWALGAIMNLLGPQSVWYRSAIYFYLHFMYNGFIIMSLITIFFHILERMGTPIRMKDFKWFYWSVNIGIVLSFFLSVLFADPPLALNLLGGMGALSQLGAFVLFFKIFHHPLMGKTSPFSHFHKGLFTVFMVLWCLKMLLQLLTAFPYFAHLAAVILDFTIGYLHLVFLGVVTLALFLFLDYFRLLKIPKWVTGLYVLGFVVSEDLLFYRGTIIWQRSSVFNFFDGILVLGYVFIPLALVLILVNNLKPSK